jgi:phospholipid/cholesterol/gamma-HCH transport system substrate-binding protein|tara:strand:+ start:16040 stop:16999 length:960 start_codon:yes stop_codon:yes gene_type:complete
LKITQEIKTAILVLLGILLFIFIFNYLKGENLLSSSRKITAVYDNVEGLVPSAVVTINGHKIGKVQDISFTEDGSGKLEVLMLIDSNFKFSKNSTAELYESGLIGGKAIAIIPANDGAANVSSGDVLRSKIKPGLTDLVNQRLTPLQQKIEKVMESTDVLLANINSVFDEKTKSNIRGSFSQLKQTITSFESTSNALNALLEDNKTSITTTLFNFSDISKNLSEVSSNLAEADLKQTINGLQSTISNFDQLLKNIEKGEGSIGRLMKDEGLYNNLEGALGQMEALLEDMKLNPKRYVHFSLFGKKPKPYSMEDSKNKTK